MAAAGGTSIKIIPSRGHQSAQKQRRLFPDPMQGHPHQAHYPMQGHSHQAHYPMQGHHYHMQGHPPNRGHPMGPPTPRVPTPAVSTPCNPTKCTTYDVGQPQNDQQPTHTISKKQTPTVSEKPSPLQTVDTNANSGNPKVWHYC
eukprot:scaffold91203_cov66-Cyclotella_meneghiniana.AAC.1